METEKCMCNVRKFNHRPSHGPSYQSLARGGQVAGEDLGNEVEMQHYCYQYYYRHCYRQYSYYQLLTIVNVIIVNNTTYILSISQK